MAVRVPTPFGISKWVLLALYTVFVTITGYAAGAIDPMKRLLFDNGVMLKLTPDDDIAHRSQIEYVTNFGWAVCIVASLFVGEFSSKRRPKYVAIWSQVLYFLGFAALFLTDDPTLWYIGIGLIGGSFPALFNAHTSVSCLFGHGSMFVFTFLGAGPDMSMLMPVILYYITRWVDQPSPVEYVIIRYLAILAVIVVLEFFFVPKMSFFYYQRVAQERKSKRKKKLIPTLQEFGVGEEPEEPEEEQEDKAEPPLKPDSRIMAMLRRHAIKRPEGFQAKYEDESIMRQAIAPTFWTTGIFFTIHLLKRYHMLNTFRDVTRYYAEQGQYSMTHANIMAEALNIFVAVSFAWAVMWGKVADAVGPLIMAVIVGTLSLATSVLIVIPYFPLQWLTILLFCLWSSYVFGLFFTSLCEYFGVLNVTHLQGVHMTITGILSLGYPRLMDYLDHPFISIQYLPPTLQGTPMFQKFNYGVIAVSVITLMLPFVEYFFFLKPHLEELYEFVREEEAQKAAPEADKDTMTGTLDFDELQKTLEAANRDPAEFFIQTLTRALMQENLDVDDLARALNAQAVPSGSRRSSIASVLNSSRWSSVNGLNSESVANFAATALVQEVHDVAEAQGRQTEEEKPLQSVADVVPEIKNEEEKENL